MTKELLLARKAEMEAARAENKAVLEQTRERLAILQATDHTIHGAIQDCEHWLERIPAEPDPPVTASTAGPQLLDTLKDRKAKREGATA